ncbi:MAG: hypothetical protein HQL43_03975 [Alphaproteobacteria bacterium]|nr:hypothetical protein [Alphaproteobacteria bacterium]
MTRSRSSPLLLRTGLLCLLLVRLAGMAWAEEQKPPRTDCPNIYGRWGVTHVMDKYGNPQPVAPEMRWVGMLAEAQIGKEKAVLIWHGGEKKVSYARSYKFKQTEYEYDGISKKGESLNAVVLLNDSDYGESYPKDKCYLEIIEKGHNSTRDHRHNILMEKLE